ncbi:hypothetical protein GBAR_LOCUS2669 [Geodia barretti]|uniref:Uncharacterized protein n=1 Tax=Geodia barretti TaxID=519541 RepID=A0AA35R1A4_GEOBA|nr:hypothetical protein GBAR_LOCUS2669 [Geodia barretti]
MSCDRLELSDSNGLKKAGLVRCKSDPRKEITGTLGVKKRKGQANQIGLARNYSVKGVTRDSTLVLAGYPYHGQRVRQPQPGLPGK